MKTIFVTSFIIALGGILLMNSDTVVIRFGIMAASWLNSLSSPALTSYELQRLIILMFVLACGTSLVIRFLKERRRDEHLPSPVQQTRPLEGPPNVEQPRPSVRGTAPSTPQPAMPHSSPYVQSISNISGSYNPVLVGQTVNYNPNVHEGK